MIKKQHSSRPKRGFCSTAHPTVLKPRWFFVLLTFSLCIPFQSIAADLTVRVGVYDNPPLVSVEKTGTVAGFAVDILRSIADREGWQIEFVPGTWQQCLQRLSRGSIDLQVAISQTAERTTRFDFCRESLITNWGRLFRKTGSGIESPLDLEGKTIALLENDVHADAFRDLMRQFNISANLVPLDSYDHVFRKISEGDIDCGVVNRLYAMENQHKFRVEPTPLIFNPTHVLYAVPKRKHQNLLRVIDRHLKALKSDEGSLYYHRLQFWFNGQQHWHPLFPLWLKLTLSGCSVLFLITLINVLFLKSKVRKRTAELARRNSKLRENQRRLELEIQHRKSTEKELTVHVQALQKSEARYAGLFSNNHTVMLLIDPGNGAIIEANPAACTYYGYSCRELQAMNIADINILGRQEIQAEMEQAKRKQKTCFHFRHRLCSGEIRDVEVFSGPIEIDERILLCSVIHDISARTAAEAQVRRSKEQWERTFHSFTDIVTLQDPEMRIVKINQAGCRLLEKPCEDLIGKYCHELFGESDTPCAQCPLVQTRQTRQPYSREIYNEKLGKTFLVSAAPVLDRNGDLEYIAHVAKDISPWKKMEQQLFLNEKMTTIAGLTAGVAHEINTPLSAILQSLEVVLRGLDPENDRNRKAAERHKLSLSNLQAYLKEKSLDYFIDGARQSAIKAGDIIKNLLEFSSPGASEKTPVDLKKVIRATLQLAQADYELKKDYNILDVNITEEYSSELPAIPCVSTEIERALLNLIKNSVQAMGVSGDRERRLTLRTELIDNSAAILVRDNGPGFEKEVEKQLFDPFFTTREVGKGTGLGLTVAYTIIHNMHRGKIEVSSTPARGTTFTVILPLVDKDVMRGTGT